MSWLVRLKEVDKASDKTLQKQQNKVSVVSVGAIHGPFQNTVLDAIAARLNLFSDRGLALEDAENLVVKLRERDMQEDDRRLCIECTHVYGGIGNWRCSQWRKHQHNGSEIPADFVTSILHRCSAFSER